MLVGSNAAVNLSQATADDHAMLLRVNRRFANGLMIDVNYTWSKNIDNTDTVEDNQGFNAGGGARGASHYLYDFDKNRRIGYSDVWGWYDGNTRVTLPSGRVITPLARTHRNYNPDAFAGQIITLPDGRNIVDQYWYGSAAITFDEIRTDNRFNLDMSVRREFPLPNDMRLEFGADAMHILNHTQFSGSYNGALGRTVTSPTAAQVALGLRPGKSAYELCTPIPELRGFYGFSWPSPIGEHSGIASGCRYESHPLRHPPSLASEFSASRDGVGDTMRSRRSLHHRRSSISPIDF